LVSSKPSIISTITAPVTRSSPKTISYQCSSPVTRSQTKQMSAINFDESSAAWLTNKNKLANGMYSYKNSAFGNCHTDDVTSDFAGITTRSGKVLSA